MDGLEKVLETQRLSLEEVKTQLANARAEMETPFAKEAELVKKVRKGKGTEYSVEYGWERLCSSRG